MRTPQENAEGYAAASAIHFAEACAAICFSSTDRATTTFTTRAARNSSTGWWNSASHSSLWSIPTGTLQHLYNLLGSYIEEHFPDHDKVSPVW